jgi:hypothetical protein
MFDIRDNLSDSPLAIARAQDSSSAGHGASCWSRWWCGFVDLAVDCSYGNVGSGAGCSYGNDVGVEGRSYGDAGCCWRGAVRVALMATTTCCDESDFVNTLGRSWSGECAVSIVVPLVVVENDECVGRLARQCQWRWEGETRRGKAFISDQRSSDVRLIRGKH